MNGTAAALSLSDLAALLLVAEREAKAAADQRDAVWDELLARMDAESVATLDLPEALVTYLSASSSQIVDTKALVAKVEALGARLRDLDARNVDDEVPVKTSRRAASLRITPKL